MKAFFPRAVVAAAAALLLAAAAMADGASDAMPAAATRPGRFAWADLFTGNLESAASFYSGLFGWSEGHEGKPRSYQSKSGERREYLVLERGGVPIAGIVQRASSQGDKPARWIGYASVTDARTAAKAAADAGGQVVAPVHEVRGRGHQAIVLDPEGVPIGVLQSVTPQPANRHDDAGQWTWFELFSRTPRTATAFYRRVFDYAVQPDTRTQQPDHFLFSNGSRPIAGVAPLPQFPDAQPDWLGFVRVDDIEAAAAKVKTLGGDVLESPEAAESGSRFAIVSDPTGGVFGLVEFSPAEGNIPAKP